MNNLLSYCGLVDAKIRASDIDLPVSGTYYLLPDKNQLVASIVHLVVDG